MANLLLEGFDHFNNTTELERKWPIYGGQVNVNYGIAGRTGTGSAAQFNSTGWVRRVINATTATLTCGVGLYIPSASASTPGDILSAVNGSTVQWSLSYDGNGYLKLSRGQSPGGSGGTVLVTSSSFIASNTWAYVEVQVVGATGATGSVTLKINQSVVGSASSVQTCASSATLDHFTIGTGAGGSTNPGPAAIFDDIYCNDSSGAQNNGFEGDSAVRLMKAVGNGRLNQYGAVGGRAAATGAAGSNFHTLQQSDGASSVYRLAETVGTTATDSVGTSNGTYSSVGITYNQAAMANGDASQTGAAQLTGSSSYMQTPYTDPNGVSGAFSIECIANQTSGGTLFSNDNPNSTNKGFALRLVGSTLEIRIGNGTSNNGGVGFTLSGVTATGATLHVVLTYDGQGTWQVYVNGICFATQQGWTYASTANKLNFGTLTGGDNINAKFEACAIYPLRLSQQQVANHAYCVLGTMTGGNYTSVGETNVDDDASYVFDSTVSDVDLYTLDQTQVNKAVSVLAVQQTTFARKDDAGARTLAHGVGNGTTENFDAGTVLSNSWVALIRNYDTNPVSGAAWAKTDLPTLQAGVKTIA